MWDKKRTHLRKAQYPQNVGHDVRIRVTTLIDNTGMNLTQFCRITGIPQGTMSSIIHGRSDAPSIGTIKWLCDCIGITLVEFFDPKEFGNTNGGNNNADSKKEYWLYG